MELGIRKPKKGKDIMVLTSVVYYFDLHAILRKHRISIRAQVGGKLLYHGLKGDDLCLN